MFISEQFSTSTEAYPKILRDIYNAGLIVPTRLGSTREYQYVVGIEYPQQIMPIATGRRFNYFGMLAESIWPLTNIKSVNVIETFNSRIREFSDDGAVLYGAYGPRLYGLVDQAVELLSTNPDDRQVVLNIYDKWDLGHKTKDMPCNTQVMFKIRNGMLNMTVTNRSNDIHWGLFGVNLPQFAFMQNYIANRVGVPLGTQSHVTDSLHLYTESKPHQDITNRMMMYIGHYYHEDLARYFQRECHHTFQQSPIDVLNKDQNLIEFDILLRVSAKGDRETLQKMIDSEKETTAMRTFAELLVTYGEIKHKGLDRLTAIYRIIENFDKIMWHTDDRSSEEYVPHEWVWGCISTLINQLCDSGVIVEKSDLVEAVMQKYHDTIVIQHMENDMTAAQQQAATLVMMT